MNVKHTESLVRDDKYLHDLFVPNADGALPPDISGPFIEPGMDFSDYKNKETKFYVCNLEKSIHRTQLRNKHKTNPEKAPVSYF